MCRCFNGKLNRETHDSEETRLNALVYLRHFLTDIIFVVAAKCISPGMNYLATRANPCFREQVYSVKLLYFASLYESSNYRQR